MASDPPLGRIDTKALIVILFSDIYGLAAAALAAAIPLSVWIARHLSTEHLNYDEVYEGRRDWRLQPVVDHSDDPARLLVSGTGLTHQRGADQRQSMHAAGAAPTDSLRMYELGVERGKPSPGSIGSAPEWFYKGNGTLLCGHNDPLTVPSHAEDGGEEPEIASGATTSTWRRRSCANPRSGRSS